MLRGWGSAYFHFSQSIKSVQQSMKSKSSNMNQIIQVITCIKNSTLTKKEDSETLKTSWRGMKHFQHKPAASHHSLVFPRLVGTENLVALLLKIYLWDILYLLQSAHTVLFCRPSLWRIQLLQSCTSLYGDLEQEWNIWHPPKQLLLHRRNFDAQLTPPASI